MAFCTSFPDLASFFSCAAGTLFGGDGTVFTLAALIVFAFFAYKARLNSTLSLAFAWSLVYAFYLLFGGASPWLEMIFALLTIGLAVRLVSAILSYSRQ